MALKERHGKSGRIHARRALAAAMLAAWLVCCSGSAAKGQDKELRDIEVTLDVNSATIALAPAYRPNIDLSGRGFHSDPAWPQSLASGEAIETWSADIGLQSMCRLSYNLWEISLLPAETQEKLLASYESVIKRINDAGGVVLLNIFGTPRGMSKVLDKRSVPVDMRAFKALIRSHIQRLSCEKRYAVWYEVWNAPDLDEFFLGRQQDYLNLYRAVAETIRDIESQTRIHIPVGGPSVSWWFKSCEGNTVLTPERSLIYELIRFCYKYKLPLNFISWHAFSTDPKAEKASTLYGKNPAALVREWLSYFNFEKDLPLIIDEWNYDSGANILPERREKAALAASFIPARLRHMYEADITHQVFYALEDFQDNKEGVVRNVGAFWYDQSESGYMGGSKAIYNVMRMLAHLGPSMYISPSKLNDEFAGLIATKGPDGFVFLVYNYIDPYIATSFLSRSIAQLSGAERRTLLDIVKSDRLSRLMKKEQDISTLRTSKRVKNLLRKALELYERAEKSKVEPRAMKLAIKNLKSDYAYLRYSVDTSCSANCDFKPIVKKEIAAGEEPYQEQLTLAPYSVQMIVLKLKPKEQELPPIVQQSEPAAAALTQNNQTGAAAVAPSEAAPAGVHNTTTTSK